MDYSISAEERAYLRKIAAEQIEISSLSVMEQRKKHWFDHNELKSDKPIIVMETKYCENDLFDLRCESEAARRLEHGILRYTERHKLVNDDTVIPDFFEINWDIDITELGFDMTEKRAVDGDGNAVGYTTIHHLENLENDFSKIQRTSRAVDRDATQSYKSFAEDTFGDILPVVIKNQPQLNWYNSPSKKVVYLMGTAAMMMAPYDSPEKFLKLYDLLVESALETYQWLIDENLLCLNNDNDYAGSGSYGFTTELPTEEHKKTGKLSMKDLWCNLNSQESVGVSPDMYGEYFFPFYKRLAERFGLVYYGCCEPVDPLWDDYISKLPNLRKVSVSPWADLEVMGEKLRGSNFIYSRKPSPNLIAIKGAFNEEDYRNHIKDGVIAARGCHNEIVCRDVYALYGERKKLGTAVNIIRETVDKYWK